MSNMNIRKAKFEDLSRIAEIYVWNNRINYFPVFQDEAYSFGKLQVGSIMNEYFKQENVMCNLFVFDDGLLRGFMEISGDEICKIYVDPFFQNRGIGHKLIEYAVRELNVDNLWALEKNERAIAFYQRHGFHLTGTKMPIENTLEYVVKLER